MPTRTYWLVFVGLALGASALLFTVRLNRRAETTPALHGVAVARQLGCFACHGTEGRGGVTDPGSRNGRIPGWDHATVACLVADEQELKDWILDGQPVRLKKLATVARRAPLVPMPAYRRRINETDLADLLTYFRAVSLFGKEMTEPVYEGWKVADRLGCFGCHGPSGTGGYPNPGSFKGHIPAWEGDEFPELVKDDAELAEWILNGHPRRLWENPLARHFLEGQVIQMPAYRAHLSADEQARLVAYFQWLRKKTGTEKKTDDTHRIMGLIATPGTRP